MKRNIRIVRAAHKCQTPIEALELKETCQAIALAMLILRSLDSKYLHESHEEGRKRKWRIIEDLRFAGVHAENRLRKEFLSVQK